MKRAKLKPKVGDRVVGLRAYDGGGVVRGRLVRWYLSTGLGEIEGVDGWCCEIRSEGKVVNDGGEEEGGGGGEEAGAPVLGDGLV